MKKSVIISILLIFFIVISFFGIVFNEDIIKLLISLDKTNYSFLFLYLFICLIYFVLPLPVTLIILMNGYLFKNIGFFISLFLIFLSSIFLFSFSKLIIAKFDLNLPKYFLKKKISLDRITTNSNSVLISRYLIPFFFHNLYYGSTSINIKKFFLVIFLAEIPMTYALNTIGLSIKNFTLKSNLEINSIIFDKNFYISLSIIIFIFIFMKYIKKIL